MGNKPRIQPIISTQTVKGQTPRYREWLKLDAINESITVPVAIIDNGIDPNHDGLRVDLITSRDFTGEGMRAGLHGTHVGGIVSSDKYGLVDLARLVSYKALSAKTGAGSFTGIAKAIDLARTSGVDVINMSLGSESASSIIEVAIDKYCKRHPERFIIVATGNDGYDTGFPAWLAEKYMNVIAVGSGNMVTKNRAVLSSFSSRRVVTLIAQGENVLSTAPNNKYEHLSGTSMATPLVSACIALAKSLIPDFNCYDFYEIMKRGNATIDLMAVGKDVNTGYGYLLPYEFYKEVKAMKMGTIKRGERVGVSVKEVGFWKQLKSCALRLFGV